MRSRIVIAALLILFGPGRVPNAITGDLASIDRTTQTCPSTITHSSSQEITLGNSANCSNGPPQFIHSDSSYWRAFQMGTFNGGQQYDVSSVSFGVENAVSGDGTGQPVTVRLYVQNVLSFPNGTRTLIAAITVTVTDQKGTIVEVPLTGTVPAGTGELVMEVFTPSGLGAGNSFFIGSNSAPETAPSYISADVCGSPLPTETGSIGYPDMHVVFNVNGNCRTGSQATGLALNISTRLRVEAGDNAMIGGFILAGNEPKALVLRGLGPSLVGAGDLADPVLALYGSDGSLIFENDNWRETQQDLIQGTIYEPADPRESVMRQTLPPGAYSAVLAGKNQTSGLGLIEIYDDNQAADSELANISTRGLVQTGNNVMIGGFILGGNTGNTHVAIRGIGPSLAQSGLSNVLPDPTLELHDNNGATLISNDNWRDDPTTLMEFLNRGLSLQNDLESGIFISLPPGAFTVVLAGRNGAVGVGLVEVYNLH